MDTLNIASFATFRDFIRLTPSRQLQDPQIIRVTFPHALFGWSNNYRKIFLEIAWSFLSTPKVIGEQKTWMPQQNGLHRVGGLPALIMSPSFTCDNTRPDTTSSTISTYSKSLHVMMIWYYRQTIHRADRDPYTRMILPAINSSRAIEWRKHGKLHRKDRDPHTQYVLPAYCGADGRFTWNKRGELHRSDWDCATATLLPAVISRKGAQFYINGQVISY